MVRSNLKIFPFYIQRLQGDFASRLQFTACGCERMDADEYFLNRYVLTDEATFSVSGRANTHTHTHTHKPVISGTLNLHVSTSWKGQARNRLSDMESQATKCMDTSFFEEENNLLGPISEHAEAAFFHSFELMNKLMPSSSVTIHVCNFPLACVNSLTKISVTIYVVVTSHCETSSSPNLSTLGFAVWGYVKNCVNAQHATDVRDLRERLLHTNKSHATKAG
jgi:hypothetical protein